MGRGAILLSLICLWVNACKSEHATVPSPKLSAELSTELSTATLTIPRAEFTENIGARSVSFMARDLETDTVYVLEGSDLDTRYTPWSTFKIPNLILALETNAAPNLDHKIIWDKEHFPAQSFWPKSWQDDLTLRQAFRRSAAWYFRDISLKVPNQVYRDTLSDWGYGNVDITDGSDSFWLDRTLKISVNEQTAFLARLTTDELNIQSTSFEALKNASRQFDTEDKMTLHGKTGSGPILANDFDGEFEGWFVGFTISDHTKPTVFALYTRAENYDAIRNFRQDFAITLLEHTQLLRTK